VARRPLDLDRWQATSCVARASAEGSTDVVFGLEAAVKALKCETVSARIRLRPRHVLRGHDNGEDAGEPGSGKDRIGVLAE
jgi:hypothetical protein